MVHYSAEVSKILEEATANVDQVAKVLGIGRRQAYEAVKRGDIPSIRIGKRILISTRVIQRLLDGPAFGGDDTGEPEQASAA